MVNGLRWFERWAQPDEPQAMMSASSGAERLVRDCVGVRRGESVLILIDPPGDQSVAHNLAAAATRYGAHASVVEIATELLTSRDGDVDNARLDAIAAGTDVLLGVTSRSLYHSMLGRRAIASGKRLLALTGVTATSLREGAIEADFAALEERCKRFADRLTDGRTIVVTTARGTHLSADISGRTGCANTGRALHPGERSGGLDVEAFIAPNEESVTGVLVVDASTTLYGLVDQEIRLEFDSGRLRSWQGGAHAQRISQMVSESGASMAVVAELGFGLNPSARVVGNIVEDEATYGTGHVALGSNDSFGGANPAPLHFDMVYWQPSVMLDGQPLMDAGELR